MKGRFLYHGCLEINTLYLTIILTVKFGAPTIYMSNILSG